MTPAQILKVRRICDYVFKVAVIITLIAHTVTMIHLESGFRSLLTSQMQLIKHVEELPLETPRKG